MPHQPAARPLTPPRARTGPGAVRPELAAVHDLAAHRSARQARLAAEAGGPVRYLPQAFVDALQGSWGPLPVIEPARACR